MEVTKERVSDCIKILETGNGFSLGNIGLRVEKNTLIVGGESSFIRLENINSLNAMQDIQELKKLYFSLITEFEELNSFASKKQIEFLIGYTYGMGALHVCKEVDGKFIYLLEK